MDLDRNLLKVTQPLSESHAFTYNALRLMAIYRTPRNHAYSFTYDDLGCLLRDDDPARRLADPRAGGHGAP